jgi:hypothetical protein
MKANAIKNSKGGVYRSPNLEETEILKRYQYKEFNEKRRKT